MSKKASRFDTARNWIFPPTFLSAMYLVFGLCRTVAGFAAGVLLRREEPAA